MDFVFDDKDGKITTGMDDKPRSPLLLPTPAGQKDSENIQETESDSTPSVNLPSKTKPKSKYTVEIKKT